MRNQIENQMKQLTPNERAELEQLAKRAEMSLRDDLEYFQKALIYRHAEERLGLAA